jgi:transposase
MTMPSDDHVSNTDMGVARRIEVFTGAGRRREWSAARKAAILAESYAGASSVCDVARRHGLAPSQLFTWRRIARRKAAAEVAFAPIVVEPAVAAASACSPERDADQSHVIKVHIECANVWIWRDAPAGIVTAIIGALKAGS